MKNLTKDIKLLIFDLDGTLVNSLPDLMDSVNYALSKMNCPLIDEKQTKEMVGGGLKVLLDLAIGDSNIVDYEQTRQFFMEYYTKNYVTKTTFYKNIPEVLNHFSDKMKAVYSNKLHNFTVKTIQKTQLESHFEMILGAKPDEYKPKPSPEGIYHILKELNIKAENTIMIGDSTHDIDAGKAAGTLTCGVTYGYRSKEILMQSKPDFLIDDIRELIAVFE